MRTPVAPLARLFLAFSAASLAVGCASLSSAPAPGMHETQPQAHAPDPALSELARVEGVEGERSLLVVYPRSACSGSASGVVVDENRHYLGAIAPGTAALLRVPASTRAITAFSSVEVTAPVGAWFTTVDIPVPPAPRGIVFRTAQLDARHCGGGNGQYFNVATASKAELEHELQEAEVRWFEPGIPEGQAWLDGHRARVDDILDRTADTAPEKRRRIVVR